MFKDLLLEQAKSMHRQSWLVHELTHRKMHFKVLSLKVPKAMEGFYPVTSKPVPKIVHKLMAQLDLMGGSGQAAVTQQNTLDF